MVRALTALVVLLVAHRSFAEPVGDDDWAVSHWHTHDGLPQSSVTSIVQTRDGYLWLGTFGGVARFDGLTFQVFSLADTPALGSNRVVALFEDAAGTLWIGGEEGLLARYRAGRFEAVRFDGGPRPDVNQIAQARDGSVWLATSGGLFVVREDHVEAVALDGDVPAPPYHGLAFDGAGALWLAAPKGLACVQGPCGGGARTTELLTIARMRPARDGSLYVVADARLLHITADATTVVREVGRPTDGWTTAAIAFDDVRGALWLAHGTELWRRDAAGTWLSLGSLIAPFMQPSNDNLRSLLVDRDGTLWVGTSGSGLLQLRALGTQELDLQEGLGFSAVTVIEDGAGRMWVNGQCEGLYVLEPGAARFVERPVDLACPEAMAVAPDGVLWVGGHGAIARVGDEVTRFDIGVPTERGRIRAMAFDARGHLWVGAGSTGLRDVEVTPTVRVAASYDAPAIPAETIVTIEPQADGSLWLGTTHGALHRSAAGQLVALDEEHGLAPGMVRAILADPDGTVWFGTYGGGLSRLRDGIVRTFTRADGLCDDTISRIFDDGRGSLWMNGNQGLARVPRADFDDVGATLRCTHYESLEGNGGAQPAGWRARDGRLWFPNVRGVAVVDPSAMDAVTVAPIADIVEVLYDGDRVDSMELGAGEGDVTVRYTGLSFDAPAHVTFRHRLLGHSDTWTRAVSDRAVSYKNLAPGAYEFEVQARGPRGAWSASKTLAFSIAPHLWETAWFVVAMIALAVVLLVIAFNVRVRVLVERRAAEAHALEREAHYRAMFDHDPNGLVLHADGRVVEVNAAAAVLCGMSREELAKGFFFDRFAAFEDARRYRELIKETLLGKVGAPIEVVLLRVGGGRVVVRAQAVRLDFGSERHALVTLVDLTATLDAQRRAHEAERARSH